jgi:glucose/arabinose dehydrogenase
MKHSRLVLALLPLVGLGALLGFRHAPVACDPGNAGLKLPAGFCATLFAEVGGARHVAVSADGVVYVASSARTGGGVTALRDADGDGHAEARAQFGPGGGTGVAVSGDAVYFGMNDRIIRYPRRSGELAPSAEGTVIVSGLPTGGHSATTMALGPDGAIYVDHGSRSNSCQEQDRSDRSPGVRPCPELSERAGVWRYDATRAGQTPTPEARWATGLRNAMALAVNPSTGLLWGAPHGRDQLAANWGFPVETSAEKPAEEFGPIAKGADYGWPYCYFDPITKKKVLAPEYGGDGERQGECADKTQPAIGFPGHWAPMALAFYPSDRFGPAYRGGAFMAFHGSWNRAPLPQAGFRVVFIPFANGQPTGEWSTFAIDAESPTGLRASGVAVGPDGAVYVASDQAGKVWRITRAQ